MRVPRAGRLACALGLLIVLGAGALATQNRPGASGRADRPAIVDLSTARDGPTVLVSFRLDGAMDARTREKIESGLPTGFTYTIEVREVRRGWLDRTVADGSVQVLATYNALTREYLVNFRRDGELYASRVVTQEEDLEAAMTRFENLPSVRLDEVPAGRLTLRVRAELGVRTRLGLIPDRVHTPWAHTEPIRETPRNAPDGGDQ